MDVIAISDSVTHTGEASLCFNAMAKILDAKSIVYDTGLKV